MNVIVVGFNISWDNNEFSNNNTGEVIFKVDDCAEQFYENEEYFYGVYDSKAYLIQKLYFKPKLTEAMVKLILEYPAIANNIPRNEEWCNEQYNKIDWSKTSFMLKLTD